MHFKVVEWGSSHASFDEDVIILETDNWDDYGFKTLFTAYYMGESIGYVKIGFRGMVEGDVTAEEIPHEFDQLPKEFFSLWQSEKAYETIRAVELKTNASVFGSLRDIAANSGILEENAKESSLQISLFRSVSEFACRGQFRRIALGGSAKIEYSFRFTASPKTELGKGLELSFEVLPDDYPPSNVHAIIGRNGIGKTRLLQDMIRCICGERLPRKSLLFGTSESANSVSENTFANVICIAFSPFDGYKRIVELADRTTSTLPGSKKALSCHYIGLNREDANLLDNIRESFIKSYGECLADKRKTSLWLDAIEILKSDPVFSDACSVIASEEEGVFGSNESISKKRVEDMFESLSSGHKVVLSIVTSCVRYLEERTIVFIDEPENHLHPPLLLSFIYAMSFLLMNRNSAAIMATHSPVVLQEIPSSCVWIVDRSGDCWSSERPSLETFGASFESLMSQVFKYEVQKSGFYSMLEDAVNKSETLGDAIGVFNGHLGNVADSIICILWANKKQGNRK